MARLAIRAIGDKSRRENVTTGNKWVEIDIIVGNSLLRRFIVDDSDDTVTLTEHNKDDGHVCTSHFKLRNGIYSELHNPSDTHSA